ncbi:uncharacterized protein N7498_001990, partial [Penicillium cinerascens]
TSQFPSAVQSGILQRKGCLCYISTRHPVSPLVDKFENGRASMMTPTIYGMFETKTGTWQYVIADTATTTAAIVDPVLDYDPVNQILTDRAANSLVIFIKETGLRVDKILETHIPEDHISAAPYLQRWLSCDQGYIPPVCLGCRVKEHQGAVNHNEKVVHREEYQGSCLKLLRDEETFNIGELVVTAVHLPGHSPHHLGYKIGDNVLCGDTILHPDIGTARCDLPGGNAHELFESCQRLLSLPDHVRIWPGHDSLPGGREPIAWMAVRDHKERNKHLRSGIGKEEFVALRGQEDAGLAKSKNLHQQLQISLRAGRSSKSLISGLQKPILSLNLESPHN